MRPGRRRVHQEPRGLFGYALVVVGFIHGHWCAHGGSSGSSCVTGFIGVRTGERQGSLSSLGGVIVVVGFVWCLWVHWGEPWRSSGSSGVTGLIGVHPGGRLVRQRSLGSLEYALGVVGFVRGR